MATLWKKVMDYSSDILSSIFFVVWIFQILRSGYYYYRFSISKRDLFDIAFIHSILFAANILYLIYEFDVVLEKNPIWLIFTMYFLLNIASIWGFSLITIDHVTGKSNISPRSMKIYKGLIVILIVVYIGCWLGDSYGIKCTNERFPMGLFFMTAFATVWSLFVLRQLRDQNQMLKLHKEGVKAVLQNSKKLLIDHKKKEFCPVKQQIAQQNMFIILQIAIFLTLMLNFLQRFFFYIYYDVEDKESTLKGSCILEKDKNGKSMDQGTYLQDSSLTELLVCFELSLPIQQFISCFYTIPLQYSFFDQDSIAYYTEQNKENFDDTAEEKLDPNAMESIQANKNAAIDLDTLDNDSEDK